VVIFIANIYTSLDRGMDGPTTTLPLIVFTQKNLCSRFYLIKLEVYSQKRQIRFLSHPTGVRGNVRTSSIARWKARGRLPIRSN